MPIQRYFGRSRTPVVASSVMARRIDNVCELAERGPVLISFRGVVELVLILPTDLIGIAYGGPMSKARLRRHRSLSKDLRRLGIPGKVKANG